ncbi:MAG: chemotaxis protein CheC [Oscillatoriaceae cyanobacterium Prado104]|nr:chemotaxis protein CheC [Oscillatoriaceae cyanobacterium Prado104]
MLLTADEIDAIKELINIGVGQAAAMLNEMLQFPIELQIPEVDILSRAELQEVMIQRFGLEPLSLVELGFNGAFCGSAQLLFPTESALNLVSVLTGEDKTSPDLDSLKTSTLTEVGNMLINGVMGSIGNVLDQNLEYEVPYYLEEGVAELLREKQPTDCNDVLLAPAHFYVKELEIQGDILLFFDVGSFKVLLQAIAAVS